MLKNVSVLLTLSPFIDAGLVHFVPDPMEFNAVFRRALFGMVNERAANWRPRPEEMRHAKALAKDDYERANLRLPDEELRRRIRKSQPDVSPELVEKTIEAIQERLV